MHYVHYVRARVYTCARKIDFYHKIKYDTYPFLAFIKIVKLQLKFF